MDAPRRRILLVEDEPFIAMAGVRILDRHGYEAQSVYSGEAAVEAVRGDGETKPHVDLVLMDIDLGRGIDGTEAARRILATRELPIVFLSSHTERDFVERVKAITRYGYVLKSAGEFVLVEAISTAFELFEANRHLRVRTEELRSANERLNAAVERLGLGNARLRKAERHLRVTLQSIGDGVITTDPDGRVTGLNPAAQKLTGWTDHEAVGRPLEDVLDLVRSDTRKPIESPVARVLATGEVVGLAIHTSLLARNGNERQIADSAAPIVDEDGTVLGVVLVFQDVTETDRLRRAMERRIVALTRPLDADGSIEFDALFDLQQLQEIQDEFCAATGVASVITAVDGRPITRPSNFRRLCAEVIRGTRTGLANCFRSDAELGAPNPAGPTVRPCLSGGLWDAGASITVGGRHVANWLIGQVRDSRQSVDAIRSYARSIGADEDEAATAFGEVPAMPVEQFSGIAKVLHTLANYLSDVAFQNVQQARLIDRLERVEARTARQNRVMRVAADVSRAINRETSLERLLETVRDQLSSVEGYDEVLIARFDSAGRVLDDGMERRGWLRQLRRELGNADYVVVRGHEGDDSAERSDDTPARGALALRVSHDRRFYGLLVISGCADYLTDDDEVWVLRGLAEDVAFAIHALHEGARARRLMRVIDRVPHPMALVDRDRTYSAVNNAYQRLFAVARETMIDTAVSDYFDPDVYRTEVGPAIDRALAGETVEYRTQTISPSGERLALHVRYIPYSDTATSDGSSRGSDPGESGSAPPGDRDDDRTGSTETDVSGVVIECQDITDLHAEVVRTSTLLHELNHRVKNNLAMVSSLVGLKQGTIGPDHDLSDVQGRIDAIRFVHEQLLSTEPGGMIRVADYFARILEGVFGSPEHDAVGWRVDGESPSLPVRSAVPLGLVLNEIATNSLKHGVVPGKRLTFLVSVEVSDPSAPSGHLLYVRARDDGRPIPDSAGADSGPSFGMRLIEAMVDQLGGTMSLRRAPHPEYEIVVPMEQPTEPHSRHRRLQQ